jgi:hypothetical protein
MFFCIISRFIVARYSFVSIIITSEVFFNVNFTLLDETHSFLYIFLFARYKLFYKIDELLVIGFNFNVNN